MPARLTGERLAIRRAQDRLWIVQQAINGDDEDREQAVWLLAMRDLWDRQEDERAAARMAKAERLKHTREDEWLWLRKLKRLLAQARKANRAAFRSRSPESGPGTTSPSA